MINNMKSFNTFMVESGAGLSKVVFGDQGRAGQGFIRHIIDSLFNNAALNSPRFGIESTKKNLKAAGLSYNQIKSIRKSVILGMKATIKELHINPIYIVDHKDKTFERYSFYGDTMDSGSMKYSNQEKSFQVYEVARKNIEAELDKLNIIFEGVDMKGFYDKLMERDYTLMEGLRGDDFYYEWYLINKTEADAIKAIKANGFEDIGAGSYRNPTTKEIADIRHTTKGWKIDISDSHGKRVA